MSEDETSLERRLALHTDRRGPDQCWLWTGPISGYGYGHIRVDGLGLRGAHRVALALATGLDLRGKWVTLHSCDTPACVNPRHLRAGDQAANMADAAARGRMPRGEANRSSILTEPLVRAIRREAAQGASTKDIATRYGFSVSHIWRIIHRKAWAWLD